MRVPPPRRPAAGSRSLAAALLALLVEGCASRPPAEGPIPLARFGPDRASVPYADHEPDAKAALLARINADRAAAGVPAVAVDLVAAKAGDAFCLDAARTGVLSHWDLAGRAPYDRFADAGGVDWHGENFSGSSRGGAAFRRDELVGLVLEAHGRMMAEKPPADGHRRTILDPLWTHVGIGVALEAGEFRMTEEFTRHSAVWIEAPASRVRAGRTVPVNVQLPKGWSLAAVEVAHESFPRPLAAKTINRRESYAFPRASQKLLPVLGPGFRYSDGSAGEVTTSGGVVRAKITLLSGAGSYWAVIYASPGAMDGKVLSPIAAVRVLAD